MSEMTEEEKVAAAAYIKLQDDVRQLIVDTIFKELQNYGSLLHIQIKGNLIHSYDLEQKIKNVVQSQMMK